MFYFIKLRLSFNRHFFYQLFQVSDTLVVSGCEGGKVKVWDIELASLVKVSRHSNFTLGCSLLNMRRSIWPYVKEKHQEAYLKKIDLFRKHCSRRVNEIYTSSI